MEIHLKNTIEMEEIPISRFNVQEINKIKKLKGGTLRQNSKGPTFSSHLWRYLPRDDE